MTKQNMHIHSKYSWDCSKYGKMEIEEIAKILKMTRSNVAMRIVYILNLFKKEVVVMNKPQKNMKLSKTLK